MFIADLELLKACQSGDIQKVKQVLEKKPDIDCFDKDNEETPLMKAVYQNNIELASLLLEHDANPNCSDKQGNTALHIAVMIPGRENMVRLLLENKANPNKINKNKNTALHLVSDNYEVTTLLLNYGAATLKDNKNGGNPISVAFTNGYNQTLKAIIDHDSTIYNFMLLRATESENVYIMEYAIKKGANINCKTIDQLTPIMLSAFREHQEGIALLVKYNADLTITTPHGEPWLHFIRTHEKQERFKSFVDSLLEQLKLEPLIEQKSATLNEFAF